MAFVALGSNLGDREAHLRVALGEIARLPSTRILAQTVPEETDPIGPPQGRYLNQMIAIETGLEPHTLLLALQDIEKRSGRIRAERWGPRTLDLDIVSFGDRTIADDVLTLPHPGIGERDFWKRELAELTRKVG